MQRALPIQIGASDEFLARTRTRQVLRVVVATALVALCAHVSVPLFFTPVPLTLQTFAVILIGLTLGPALGFATMILYLAEGAVGMPVFSPLGPGGIAQLLGPTAGFLLSYPFAAAAAGLLVRAFPAPLSPFWKAICAGVCGTVFVFAIGAGWVAHLQHLGWYAAWYLAIAPFLPGEAVKIVAAAFAYTSLRREHHL